MTDGDLPAATDCRALARFIMATAEGLAVHAADAPREELMATATLAAHAVPAASAASAG